MPARSWRVLFADDDPTARLLVQAALAGPDFSVTVVDNGKDALAEFQRAAFDIVLLDVEMPGLDGLAVGAAIRQSHGSGLPLVLVSGRRDAEFLAEARRIGASHLAKPVDWTALAAQLRTLIGTTP